MHLVPAARVVKLLAKTVRNVPDVGAQYAECYYQQQSSSNDGGSRDTQEVVDQSSRATRGARLAGSLAQFRRTHALTRSLARSLVRSCVRARARAPPRAFASLSLLVLSLFLVGIANRAFVTSARPTFPRGQSQPQTPSRSRRPRVDEGGFFATTRRGAGDAA